MRKSIKNDEILRASSILFLFSTIACAQYIPVYAKLTDGSESPLSVGGQKYAEDWLPAASNYMRHERPDHTLQTTALVHEAYLQLVGQERAQWENRGHFFGVAAQLMRRILVDHARAHNVCKRGGISPKFSLDEAMVMAKERGADLLAIDELLTRLAVIDPQQSRVIELRFFAGMSVEETAQALAISDRTVKRDWAMAKAWMQRELRRRVQGDSANSDGGTI
jgi:RNA polymerase sigma-70 factor (ECF subfamily)